jgi:hypothetical protein
MLLPVRVQWRRVSGRCVDRCLPVRLFATGTGRPYADRTSSRLGCCRGFGCCCSGSADGHSRGCRRRSRAGGSGNVRGGYLGCCADAARSLRPGRGSGSGELSRHRGVVRFGGQLQRSRVLPHSRQPGRRKPRGIRGQQGARHLAQRNQDRRHHSRRTRRGHGAADVCVVRGGGRVQRRGLLSRDTIRSASRVHNQRSPRHLARSHRGPRDRRARPRQERVSRVGIVHVTGQLQRRRGVRRVDQHRSGIRC